MDELGRLLPHQASQAPRFPMRILLDQVRSMANVGSLFRTADAFGLEGMDICGISPRPPRPEIRKVSLGAELTVPWKYWESVTEALQFYQQEGYALWALEQVHGSISLPQWTLRNPQPLVLVLGHEIDGVSEEALALCDAALEIPQFGTKHSLNVAVAAGIAMAKYVLD